jgi:hypothetical protein
MKERDGVSLAFSIAVPGGGPHDWQLGGEGNGDIKKEREGWGLSRFWHNGSQGQRPA